MGIILLEGILEGFGLSLLLPILNTSLNVTSHDFFTRTIDKFLSFFGFKVTLTTMLWLIVLVFVFKGLVMVVQGHLRSKIITRLRNNIRESLLEKFASMDYGFFTTQNIGFLNNIITVETDTAIASFTLYCVLLVSITYIAIYISVSALFNWRITTFALVVGLILLYYLKFINKLTKKYSIDFSQNNANMQKLLIQFLHNLKYLKATNSFRQLIKQLKYHFSLSSHLDYKIKFLNVISSAFIEPVCIVIIAFIIYLEVVVRKTNIMTISLMVFLLYNAFIRLFGFQKEWQKFLGYIGGLELLEKTNIDVSKNREKSGAMEIKTFKDCIELRNVNLSYGEKQVLFNINMKIKKNSSIAIVGPSGSGKTSIVDIISGLYLPSSGEIMIGEINYNVINRNSLRNRIGYVTQDPVAFNDTVANNISFWECSFDDKRCLQRIKDAAELAHCMEFISQLPDGFNTIIGDKGVKFSGGQRQRLAIAREIFKNREIIIFDEATSSLDSESERYIQSSLSQLRGKITLLIIAHRLSTVRNVDYIYVVDEGRIVQEGNWHDLTSDPNSAFSKMCQLQNIFVS